MKIYCEADADTCLARRIVRDVRDRDRDIEGCIKQWFAFVKPNFEKYVEPQRKVADVIIPRGVENQVAIKMVVQYIEQKLVDKSTHHRASLTRLQDNAQRVISSERVITIAQTPQVISMNTILHDGGTSSEDFIFYFDRLASLLIEEAMNNLNYTSIDIITPTGHNHKGLQATGEMSAVLVLRGGSTFETALRRIVPDCRTGRMLIQSNAANEPELHYLKLPTDIKNHECVVLLDAQMSSGASALMSVQVLLDHGVSQRNIVFVTYTAGKAGLHRLITVFPEITVVLCILDQDSAPRWVEVRYFRC
jgi:uridine kinase